MNGSGHPHGSHSHSHDEAEPNHGHSHSGAHEHLHGHGAGHSHGRGLRALLASVFGHSHDAADSVDSALEASAQGIRAIKVSLLALLATAGIQVVIVAISGSVALLADTIHNFADALTAVPLGIAFWIGRRKPNDRYTYGYGRAEDLAGIAIVLTIAASAAFAGWEAVQRLVDPREMTHVGWVAAAGVVGFAGNELVALYRIRVGRAIGSAALVADGLHARTDGLTSLAVVLGAAGVAAGWPRADAVVGLLITVAILVILRGAARDIYRRLMDSVDPELVDKVRGTLAASPGVEGVGAVRIRWVGHELHAEAEIVANCELSVAEGHAIGEEAHHRLLHAIPRLARATIHTNPCNHRGDVHHGVTAHHFGAESQG
ncbi:MAG TPA: cation diffusion facilitator family transporter [Actinomycetota bacterium]|nr:cation diffusion facilitator family transporter [Actinomycetota bacterium]